MVSTALSIGLSFIGWSILPDLLTSYALQSIHSTIPLLSSIPLLSPYLPTPLPPRGSPQYHTHYRMTYGFIVLSFLLYNLFQSSSSMESSYYQMLGVRVDVDDVGLKQAFRTWVRVNHPDKMGGGGSGDGGVGNKEELFKAVREGYEALKDPIVRFAYDRFGSDVLSWSSCNTQREYIRHGLLQSSGYHIVTFAGLVGLGAIGKPTSVSFWRYLLYAFHLATELSLILSPSPSPSSSPSILSSIFPNRVPYQHILFLHNLFLFSSIALSRVAPVLFPDDGDGNGKIDGRAVGRVVERVKGLVGGVESEVSQLLNVELHTITPRRISRPPISFPSPSKGIPSPSPHPHPPVPPHFTSLPPPSSPPPLDTMALLTKEMENMIIEGTLRQEARGASPLRGVLEGVFERRERGVGDDVVGVRRVRYASESFGGGWGVGKRKKVDAVKMEAEVEDEDGDDDNKAGRMLPSPRPSPPPPLFMPGLVRRGSSFVRARSISC